MNNSNRWLQGRRYCYYEVPNFSYYFGFLKMTPSPCGEVKTTEGIPASIMDGKMMDISTTLVFFVNGKKVAHFLETLSTKKDQKLANKNNCLQTNICLAKQ